MPTRLAGSLGGGEEVALVDLALEVADLVIGMAVATAEDVVVTYKDADGDEIILSSDDGLHEAVDMCRAQGQSSLRLSVRLRQASAGPPTTERSAAVEQQGAAASPNAPVPSTPAKAKNFLQDQNVVLGGAALAVGLVAVLGMALLRGGKK